MKHSENVPKAMREKYETIIQITDSFSAQHLNDEYAQMIRYAVAALCRKRPSPLVRGKADAWACGVTHAIGFVNFLYDKSNKPYISTTDLYQNFGVKQGTGQGKSRIIRDLLDLFQFKPEWTIQSKLADNPMAWMLEVNGIAVDMRYASRELQEIAYAKGLIPYIPSDREVT